MSKRGNNEGTIRQRLNGLWEARVTLPNGERKSYYGKTRAEVQRKMTAGLRDVQQGLPVPTGRQTVGQFLDRWLADVVKLKNRPRTYVSYEEAVRLHLKPALGKLSLERLTPQVIQTALTRMIENGVSAHRTAYVRNILRNALGRAVKWGLIPRNPAALTDAPRWNRRHVEAMTDAEARALLALFDGDRFGGIYTTALALGLRRGEVLGLRWSDVDFDAGTLAIGGQFQYYDGAWCYMEPKTDRSQRTLALPAFLKARLQEQRSRVLEQRLRAGPLWQDHDLVFPTDRGTPHHGENISHRFARLLRQAGMPAMRMHDLRHGAASLLLAQGVTLREIMEILGHAQINITADLYTHIAPEMKRRAAVAMDAVMTG
ncbi:MAG: tyrosine-type recombinase/integrase [Dehalococcoidia bacterium]